MCTKDAQTLKALDQLRSIRNRSASKTKPNKGFAGPRPALPGGTYKRGLPESISQGLARDLLERYMSN